MIKWSIVLILSCITVTTWTQTPPQSYFDWTELTFSPEEINQRRSKLMDLLQRQDRHGLVLIPSRDGFSSGETFRQLDDFHYFTDLELPNAILGLDLSNNRSLVFVPERDLRFENGSRPNDFPGRPLLHDSDLSTRTGMDFMPIDSLIPWIKHQSVQNILINSGKPGPVSYMSHDLIATHSPVQIMISGLQKALANLTFSNIYGSIAAIRMIKSPAEIELMRQSVLITVQGIQETAGAIRPGITERYLEGVLEGNYKKNGSHRLAFGSIIKSGPNSLWPWRILAAHYNRRNRSMQSGELVILDVGCEYNHYVSDVGRTFPVNGSFTPRQKEILEKEVAVADAIIQFIRPGITFYDIKKLTDSIIPDEVRPYMQVGLYFGHHLGLSTGDPNLPNATLQPGMIFTVEPWYYNHDEQIAVFTEDVILVTKEGCENLSKLLPRNPAGLEKMVTGN